MCSICSGALARAEKGDPDWLGRQIGRHADRANRIGEAHAAELARVARVTREVQLVREEAAELTRRADDAIPFGPHALDESQIAAWRDRARVLLEQAERFEKAIG